MLGITLILTTDLHHIAIAAIHESYRLLPPGGAVDLTDTMALAIRSTARGFALAIQISAPFLVFGLLFNLGLGVLARMMPQLQVFFLAVPASIMLVSRGYTVHEAASGVEALDLFLQNDGKIDLVVSDVVMPEMDGPTLLGELRKRNPDTKVVFVSGYAEEAFRKNLPEGEDFHFLPKPFTMKQLVETVKAAMS